MRILLSAFSCLPGAGSEQGAGWEWVLAASRRHDCTLLVPSYAVAAIEAERRKWPDLRLAVEVVALPFGLASGEGRMIRLQSAAWQFAVPAVARRLHAECPFDVAHHLTLSADWQPAGLPSLRGPAMVWGPVGGGSPSPRRLLGYLGRRGLFFEFTRRVVSGIGRRAFGDPAARRASIVLCQNDEVAARFARHAEVEVRPNVALSADWHQDAAADPATRVGGLFTLPTPRTAVFVGRLLSWKGLALALAALAQPAASEWSLLIIGDGPDADRLHGIVRRRGLDSRVRFVGPLPRENIRDVFDTADALLFPSLHEGSGWVVAEALARGCPVVTLDHGGPPALLRPSAQKPVPVGWNTARSLASALARLDGRLPQLTAWDAEGLPAVLEKIYARAVQAQRQPATLRAAAQ